MDIQVQFVGDNQFTDKQKSALNEAAALWKSTWQLDTFKRDVLGFTFAQTSDTSLEVFTKIMAADPKHVQLALNTVANGSETAATNTTSGVTTLQIAYLDNPSTKIADLVNTLSHEYTHTPEGGSYTHSYLCTRWLPWTLKRPSSVPYHIGDLTEQLSGTIGQ